MESWATGRLFMWGCPHISFSRVISFFPYTHYIISHVFVKPYYTKFLYESQEKNQSSAGLFFDVFHSRESSPAMLISFWDISPGSVRIVAITCSL